jgi:predicted  nucleic acid-binding Zn-ribbon protein
MKDMATITLPQEVAKAVAVEKERSRAKAKRLEVEIEALNKGVRELQASTKSLKQSMEDKDKDMTRQLRGLNA